MPLVPDDINELFDASIDGKSPKHWRNYVFVKGQAEENLANITIGTHFVDAVTDAGIIHGVAYGIPQGFTIYGVKVRLFGSAAAGTTVIDLYELFDGLAINKAALSIVDPPAAWATYSFTLVTPVPVADLRHYSVQCAFAKAGRRIAGYALQVGKL